MVTTGLGLVVLGTFSAGMDCMGGGTLPGIPVNTPPTAAITQPTSNVFLENGESTTVRFTAQSAEEDATLQVFLDRDSSPTNGNEIFLEIGGPGVTTLTVPAGASGVSGQATFDSTGVVNATYYAYARVDDGVQSQPVIVVSAGAVIVAAPGSRPRNTRPTIQMLEPVPNLGLSTDDTVTIQYSYVDPDGGENNAPVTVTLYADYDRNPNNDVFGDPADPTTNIIILPNAARDPNDPTFGNDPPPPDDINNPPTDPDSLEIRTNPRTLPATTVGLPAPVKTYRFSIDFTQLPPRADGKPYFLRGTINDGVNTPNHSYAIGSLSITAPASGTVDLGDVGRLVSGARFHGFSRNEFLGTSFTTAEDIDGDGVDDFVIVSRYGSPRNRNQSGAAYLFFGRRKTPFPPDRNENGLPDVLDQNGEIVDFPEPPLFIYDPDVQGNVSPYDPRVVGRFGGTISVNSIGALLAGSFYRGVTYLMPEANGPTLPPEDLRDPSHANLATAGLTSVTRVNLTGQDGDDENPRSVPDFIFGLPFISHPREFVDDDPCDQIDPSFYGDIAPNPFSDPGGQGGNDDMWQRFDFPIDTGLVIMVDGENDLANTFRQVVDAGAAGQFDPRGYVDDEGVLNSRATTPNGVRFRGAWYTLFIENGPQQLDPMNEFGADVAVTASLGNDAEPDLLVSAPGELGQKGVIYLFFATDYTLPGWFGEDGVQSLVGYVAIDCQIPTRGFVGVPSFATIAGAATGDRLSRPRSAGDINQDGTIDIMAGAPGRSRDVDGDGTLEPDVGLFYIFFTPSGGFGETDLGTEDIPRIEITGVHAGDRFGQIHDMVGDINGDTVADIAFASPSYDDDNNFNPDAGFVGVIFGDRPITGENGFLAEEVGTPALPGLRFYGPTIGARAGASVAGAGDFNRDGFGDLLITAPGETRVIAESFTDLNGNGLFDAGEPFDDRNNNGIRDVQVRKGVGYLIFGGTHLEANGPSYNLSQVTSPELPGIVFISPYVEGSQEEAPIETAAGLNDIDGDGFDDIIFGLPKADFVFIPTQRRNDAGEAYVVYGNGS
ncbi:MAG: integrin alpha [Phycisphaerae bacterium]|nr:integrin alpha [Phycisphaerae bacterium]